MNNAADQRRGQPELMELSDEFIEWQASSRAQLYQKLLRREPVRFLASHLPVLASTGPDGQLNLANKGLGLIPKEEALPRYLELYDEVLRAVKDRPWNETLPARIEAASELFATLDDVDRCRLGSLEIFEGQTYKNILGNPRIALLFTAEGPKYLSYQVDANCRVLEPGGDVYRFLRASRQLFENDSFHVPQSSYPHGYEFNVCGVKEKTPNTRFRRHRRTAR